MSVIKESKRIIDGNKLQDGLMENDKIPTKNSGIKKNINSDNKWQSTLQKSSGKLANNISKTRKKKNAVKKKIEMERLNLAKQREELISLKCAIWHKKKKIEGLKQNQAKQHSLLPKVHASFLVVNSSFRLSNMQREVQKMELERHRRDRNILYLLDEVHQLGREVPSVAEAGNLEEDEIPDPLVYRPTPSVFYPKIDASTSTEPQQSTTICVKKSQSVPSLNENYYIAPSISLTSCCLSEIIYLA